MKIFTKYLKWGSFLIVLVTFILQGVWLYQTFQLTQKNYQKELFDNFTSATRREVITRYEEHSKLIEKLRENKPDSALFMMPDDSLWAHKSYPVDIFFLELIHHFKFFPRIDSIDAILKKERSFEENFVINKIRTKDNVVLESTAPETEKEWASALKTEIIPLRVDESEFIQLYLLNPNWTIFYQMSFIIVLSALIIFLVALGLWWQYKNYINEKLLRQFQKDHTEAVVHNMATPLQTIKIATQTLQENKELSQDKREKFLAVQERQAANLESQVKKILTVSRANTSSFALNPKTVNIQELITNASEHFNAVEQKEVQIQTHFELEHPTAIVDAQMFTEVLHNLIENSIKYSGKSVTVTIDCKRTENELVVKVSDNGLGIAPKYQKHIFEKFNRGAAPFRKGAKGFGIGLSFVKVVVEAHEGTVSLFSEGENKGTSFTLRIPQ